jgi:hypothetical protein
MNRRQILPMLSAGPALLALWGCGAADIKVRKRFRVIATVEIDGQKVEGSTVMEARWRKTDGGRIFRTLAGEAMILELKTRGTVFILPYEHDPERGGGNIHHLAVESILGFQTASLGAEEIKLVTDGKGRHKFYLRGNQQEQGKRFPAFIAFKDERVPRTVFQVDHRNLAATFGPGIRFIGIDIEFTDSPVTSVLKKRLTWLVSTYENPGFDRDPPGVNRSMKDRPISFNLSYDSFFGSESR